MKASVIREMTPAELQKKLGEAERELFGLRIKVSQTPNTARIRDIRRDIARMKAALGERGVQV
jgi:large subunit ribosomal protein L29